jgi:hypothetical protein
MEETARKMDANLQRRTEQKVSTVAQVLNGEGRTSLGRSLTTTVLIVPDHDGGRRK